MKLEAPVPSRQEGKGKKRAPYEAPAIIYEGVITTRAASTVIPGPPSSGFDGSSADPANTFGGPGG